MICTHTVWEMEEAAVAGGYCPICVLETIRELRHDIQAYRGALGYPVPGDHDGRLSNGSTPVNGIAEAMNKALDRQAGR